MNKIVKNIINIINDYVVEHNSVEIPIDFFADVCEQPSVKGFAHINFGESKVCFIIKGCDYVIKIPRFENSDTDYLEREETLYSIAKCFNINKILLPLTLIKTLYSKSDKALPIYRQPRYNIAYYEERISHKENIQKRIMNITNNDDEKITNIINEANIKCELTRDFLRIIYLTYGAMFLKNLFEWIETYAVTDLHQGNYGFKNNKPVIFDYGGWQG